MSVRQGLLALIAREPMYGYQLKTEFEARTGHVWSLNIGQVYTTLARLERDGLVTSEESDDEQRTYAITDEGRAELAGWYSTPLVVESPPRDELAVKLMLAWQAEDVDVADVIQAQRTATVESLQDYTRLKAAADPDTDLLWLLILDQLILQSEAVVRWLDATEARLRRAGEPPRELPDHDNYLAEITAMEARR